LATHHQHRDDIITFLMALIIQNTQNRDSAAVQAKLDELIRVSAAQNALSALSISPKTKFPTFARNA
jgi:low affinity Fe/Cu permease